MQTYKKCDTLPFSQWSRAGGAGKGGKRSWRKRNTQRMRRRTKDPRGTSFHLGAKCCNFAVVLTQWLETSHHIHHSSMWLTSISESDCKKWLMTDWLNVIGIKKRSFVNRLDWTQALNTEVPFYLVTKALRMLHATVSAAWGLLQKSSLFLGSFTSCCHWLINKLHRVAWNQPEVNCASSCYCSTCSRIRGFGGKLAGSVWRRFMVFKE